MHSMRTFTVSRDLQKPASSIVKPACMPNTRNAARSVVRTHFRADQARDEEHRAEDERDAEKLAAEQQVSVPPPLRIAEALTPREVGRGLRDGCASARPPISLALQFCHRRTSPR